MKKYLKIFVLSAESHLSLATFIKSFFECLFYFVLMYFVFRNLVIFSGFPIEKLYLLSGAYLVVIILYNYFYENALIVRYLIITDGLERVLIKPLHPLFRILIEKINLIFLLIGLATLVGIVFFDPSKYLLLVLSGLIISFSLFISVLSLLMLTSGKFPFEKLLLGLFLIGFMGKLNTLWIFVAVAFSILFLVASIRMWNFSLRKYTSAIGQ